jgi:hypothetical protein
MRYSVSGGVLSRVVPERSSPPPLSGVSPPALPADRLGQLRAEPFAAPGRDVPVVANTSSDLLGNVRDMF